MDRRETKIAKKIIRFKHSNKIFNSIDRYFKITKVKIISSELEKEIEGGKAYSVTYRYGLNFLNPISWIVTLLIIILLVYDALKEGLCGLRASEYSDVIKIKEKEN